jgi:O-antigen/teichoic acid export membrane protein
MVLARLIAPGDFGLMAIVMAILTTMESLTDVGIQQSIIQSKRGSQDEYLNVAWWFQLTRTLVLCIVAFFIAPLVSRFYEQADLLNPLRVSLLAILCRGLVSPRMTVLMKDLRFTEMAILMQGCTILGTVATICIAFVFRNVWALVIGGVVDGILRCLTSFIFFPFRPRFHINRVCFHELLAFSKGMAGLSFLTIVALQTDVFALGKMVPADQLGMYSMALALAQQPVALFSQTVGQVLLPKFAHEQANREALRQGTLKMIRWTAAFAIPGTVMVGIFARPILAVVYGTPYRAVAIPFVLLCASVVFRIHAIVLATVYMAVGKPQLHRRYVILLALLILAFIWPGIRWGGLLGAATVLLIANAVAVCAQVLWIKGIVGVTLAEYWMSWLPRGLCTDRRAAQPG